MNTATNKKILTTPLGQKFIAPDLPGSYWVGVPPAWCYTKAGESPETTLSLALDHSSVPEDVASHCKTEGCLAGWEYVFVAPNGSVSEKKIPLWAGQMFSSLQDLENKLRNLFNRPLHHTYPTAEELAKEYENVYRCVKFLRLDRASKDRLVGMGFGMKLNFQDRHIISGWYIADTFYPEFTEIPESTRTCPEFMKNAERFRAEVYADLTSFKCIRNQRYAFQPLLPLVWYKKPQVNSSTTV